MGSSNIYLETLRSRIVWVVDPNVKLRQAIQRLHHLHMLVE